MNLYHSFPHPPGPPAGTGARPTPSFFSVEPQDPAPRRLPRGRLGIAVILLLAAAISLIFPASASALTSTGHGVGHLWAGDNVSWLGSYRLADGRMGFCLEAGKTSPVGNDYDLTTGSTALGLSAEDVAELAYLARRWAATTDANTAAAAQLAVWTITGLNGHTQGYYATRANDQREAVLARANVMLAEASTGATVSSKAAVGVTLDANGQGTVRTEVAAVLAAGGQVTVPAKTVNGTLTLVGAVFDDGTTTTTVKNGQSLHICATGTGGILDVRASAHFEGLDFDAIITVGSSGAGSQMLLFAPKQTSVANATKTATMISPKPFQPRVQTTTSTEVAAAGTRIHDSLTLSTAPGDGLLDEWGSYGPTPARAQPVPVTIRSTLLGPFRDRPTESDEWPADAPVACRVSVVATRGAGDYTTPECALPSGGYYVWVETIDPDDTPVEAGQDRLRPWKSPFAAATEVTLSTVRPTVSTVARPLHGSPDGVAPGECVADDLEVSGLGTAGAVPSFDVESVLLGPFSEAPGDGHDFASDGDFERLPVAGRATTTVAADGTYSSPCITASRAGYYVFVFRSEGSTPVGDGAQAVGPFDDLVAHTSEMFRVVEPAVPPTPEKPKTPEVPGRPHHDIKPAAPKALAFTGSAGIEPTLLAGAGAISVGLAAVLGTLVARAVNRRRNPQTGVRSSRSERL